MNRRTLSAAIFCVLFLVVLIAYANSAELVGPSEAKFGKLVQVKVSDDVPPEASIIWLVLQPADLEYIVFGRTFVCSATSSITLIASINNPHEIVTHTVAVVGDVPGPQPDPDPPKPDPGPVTSIFAVIVEETADRDTQPPGVIAALLSKQVRDYMTANNYGFKLLDKDVNGSLPPSIKSFVDLAKTKPLPRMIIADQDGVVLYDEAIGRDTTEVSLLQTLRRFGG